MEHSKVLFVDDDFICNLALSDYLANLGYSVESVDCVSAAIQAIDRGGEMSVLLTDIDLGPGPNGFELARYARTARPRIPVVYISAVWATQHTAQGVIGSEFIAKPYHPSKVRQALDRVIQSEAV